MIIEQNQFETDSALSQTINNMQKLFKVITCMSICLLITSCAKHSSDNLPPVEVSETDENASNEEATLETISPDAPELSVQEIFEIELEEGEALGGG